MKNEPMVKVYVNDDEWYMDFPRLAEPDSRWQLDFAVEISKKDWDRYNRALDRFNTLRKALVEKIDALQQEKGQ